MLHSELLYAPLLLVWALTVPMCAKSFIGEHHQILRVMCKSVEELAEMVTQQMHCYFGNSGISGHITPQTCKSTAQGKMCVGELSLWHTLIAHMKIKMTAVAVMRVQLTASVIHVIVIHFLCNTCDFYT